MVTLFPAPPRRAAVCGACVQCPHALAQALQLGVGGWLAHERRVEHARRGLWLCHMLAPAFPTFVNNPLRHPTPPFPFLYCMCLLDTQVIVEFTAKWCLPCKRIFPTYQALAAQFPTTVFLKVDVDDVEVRRAGEGGGAAAAPYRTPRWMRPPHRTAPHRTAPHRTAPRVCACRRWQTGTRSACCLRSWCSDERRRRSAPRPPRRLC
jgi:thiol-disulfide isomerase/thioredoxin